MARGMRLTAAKEHVARCLGVAVTDLADPTTMHERRGELRLGRLFETETTYPLDPSPLEAKASIAACLGLPINSVAQRGLTSRA